MREYQKHLSGHVNFIADQKVIRRLPQTSDSVAPNAECSSHLTTRCSLLTWGFSDFLFSLQLLPPPGWWHLEMIFLPFLNSPDHVAPMLTWAGAFCNLSS